MESKSNAGFWARNGKYVALVVLGVVAATVLGVVQLMSAVREIKPVWDEVAPVLSELAPNRSPEDAVAKVYATRWAPELWFDDPKTLELCRAVQAQDVEETQRLIDSGADANAKGRDGFPLLLWAYPAGKDGLECLLKNGADPNVVLESNYEAPSFAASPGSTILYTAVMSETFGDARFDGYVELFLKYGADPNLGAKKPLVEAAQFANGEKGREIFFRLIEAGADVNLCDDVEAPIVLCVSPGRCDLVLYLLERGAIYDVETPQGAALQRFLYRIAKKKENWSNYSKEEQESLLEAVKWLEERGVSFDDLAPQVNPPSEPSAPQDAQESENAANSN